MNDLRRLVLEAMIAGMSFVEACEAAGIPEADRDQLLQTFKTSNPRSE